MKEKHKVDISLGNRSMTAKIGYAGALLGTALYGLMPTFSQYGFQHGLNTFSLLVSRNVAGIIAMFIMAKIRRNSFKVTKEQLIWIFIMSLFGTMNGVFAYMSYNYLPSGIASLMAMMYIIFVVVLEWLLKISTIPKYKVVLLITSFSGVLIILMGSGNNEKVTVIGIILGLLGSLVYSCQVIMIENERIRDISLEVIFFYEQIPGMIFIPAIGLFFGIDPIPHGAFAWMWGITGAILFTIGAMSLFNNAVRLIGGGNASLIGTAEPVVSAVAGVIILNDSISKYDLAGSIIVILSIMVITIIANKSEVNNAT